MIDGNADETPVDPDAVVDSVDAESVGDPGESPREPSPSIDLDEAAVERLFGDLGSVSLEPQSTGPDRESSGTESGSRLLAENERATIDALFAELEAAVSWRIAEGRAAEESVDEEVRELLASCETSIDSTPDPDGSANLADENFVWAIDEIEASD